MPTRRTALLMLGSLPLAACATPRAAPFAPGRAVVVRRGGRTLLSEVSGTGFTADTPFRVASISKLATAETARRLAAQGKLDLDADVADLLDHPFRHPGHPDVPVTVRDLVHHTSGIRDPAEYWVAAPGDIRSLITPEVWEAGHRPGRDFRYSNLNYGLLATVLEVAGGERFDRLADRLLFTPLGLDAGFNWSGVSSAKRVRASALYRGEPGAWVPQVDESVPASGPTYLGSDADDLSAYVPGTNGTLFSPQGGLRASLNDLAVLAEAVLARPAMRETVWRHSGSGTSDEDGHFLAWGPGHYIYEPDASPLPGRRLAGHFGEAYGFHGGVWVLDDGTLILHADLGTADPSEPYTPTTPSLSRPNAEAFAKVASVL